MSAKNRRTGKALAEAELLAFFEKTQKAQDAVMAAVGDKSRVSGEIVCPVCGSGILRYFVHEEHWDAPHNSGECSTVGCVRWAM